MKININKIHVQVERVNKNAQVFNCSLKQLQWPGQPHSEQIVLRSLAEKSENLCDMRQPVGRPF